MPDANDDLYRIADDLRAIASLGLRYAQNRYDTERYEHVLAASARLLAALQQRPQHEVLAKYKDNLGYLTPMVGAESAVFRDGQVLLIRREDDGLWALPGGATEVGETWAESAVRELREEANVEGRATRLLGIFDSRLWGTRTTSHLYHAVFLVEAEDPTPVAGPETTGVGYFPEGNLPSLSPGHDKRIPLVFKLLRDEVPVPYIDHVGEPRAD